MFLLAVGSSRQSRITNSIEVHSAVPEEAGTPSGFFRLGSVLQDLSRTAAEVRNRPFQSRFAVSHPTRSRTRR